MPDVTPDRGVAPQPERADDGGPSWEDGKNGRYRSGYFILAVPTARVDSRGHDFFHPTSWHPLPATAEFSVHWVEREGEPRSVFAQGRVATFPCKACDAHPSFDATSALGDLARRFDHVVRGDFTAQSVDQDEATGPHLLAASTPCEHTGGVESVHEVDFPTGRILVNDDLRPVFDEMPEISAEVPGYNSRLGVALFDARLAAVGVARGYTSNTSPDLIRRGTGDYAVATWDEEEAWDEETRTAICPLGEPLAHISTAVWAYCLVDWSTWESRCQRQGLDPRDAYEEMRGMKSIVQIQPGRYRVTNLAGLVDMDDPAEHQRGPGRSLLMAEIVRVGPSSPPPSPSGSLEHGPAAHG